MVIDGVPKDRLLIMTLEDGWEPLCKFLGDLPVPDEPFPRVNDSVTFDKHAAEFMFKLVFKVVVRLGTVAAVPYAAFWAYRYFDLRSI
jgi:hypothetical protein